MAEPLSFSDHLDYWQRRLSPVTDWLVLSGDLHHSHPLAAEQLVGWKAAGITAVLDLRAEWTDEDFVAETAPELRYRHLGTHDDGGRRDDRWFEAGLEAWRDAVVRDGGRLLVHCHMGINRGPSMGYRLMLEAGHDPVDSLRRIHEARPIAMIDYAPDALDHFHRSRGASSKERHRDRAGVDRWLAERRSATEKLLRLVRGADD